jgi:hypothetical protein
LIAAYFLFQGSLDLHCALVEALTNSFMLKPVGLGGAMLRTGL